MSSWSWYGNARFKEKGNNKQQDTEIVVEANGKREPLEFRLTVGLRKIEGKWRAMYEHHSLPAT
jgi:ketosteroid isomerase-like protein